MRFWAYVKKTLAENLREWKVLIFVLAFSPCFVFIIYGAFGTVSHSYNIAVINHDSTAVGSHSQAILDTISKEKYADGVSKYSIETISNQIDAEKKLKNRSIDALVIFQEDFSQSLDSASKGGDYQPTKLKLYGDPRNARYSIAAIYLLTDVDLYVKTVTHTKVPVELDETLIGNGKALTDFDMYVPGIIVLALLNVLFTAGVTFIREIEKGTMQRLVMSRLKPWQFIGAISLIQVFLCMVAMFLSLAAAKLCGFAFHGSLTALLLIGIASSIGVIGLALITVSFLKSMYDLMTVGVIPYFIVMFFAGIFFPLPPVIIANLGSNVLKLNDFLPLSMSVNAFNKILNFGAGLGDIGFELAGVLIISTAYLALGLFAFNKRHMRLRT